MTQQNIDKIEKLFKEYLQAFLCYDLTHVSQCYQIPCTLSTPDKIVVITEPLMFEQEFNAIFEQLQSAKVQTITATNASCSQLTNHCVLVCIDWTFVDSEQNDFTEFSAFYHLIEQGSTFKIINVNSHELSQSRKLTHALTIK